LARLLTPSDYGLVSFILAIVEIVKTIADLGIDTLSVREFAITRQQDKLATLASNIALSKSLCSVIAYLVMFCLIWLYHDPQQTLIGTILGVLVFTTLAANLPLDYFQAQLRMHEVALPVILVNACTVAILYLLSQFYSNTIAFISVLPVGEMALAFVLWRAFRNEIHFSFADATFDTVFYLLRRSLPIAGTAILVTLYTRLDIVLLNHFLDSAEVGYYSVAYRMTEPFQMIAVAFGMSVYSHMSQVVAGHSVEAQRSARRYIAGTLSYGLVSAGLLVLIAPLFIQSFLPAYMLAIPILKILAFALIFRTVNGCLTSLIQAYGYYLNITYIALWNLVAISGLLLICLPFWGATGAAWALLIGEAINTLIQLFTWRRTQRHFNQLSSVHPL